MPKGYPNNGEKIITKDPISGKITGSKVIEFPEDKRAEEKMESFTLTDVEEKEQPERKKPGPKKGSTYVMSEEGKENISVGKRKKFRKDNYKDNPMVKLVDSATSSMINKTVLNKSINKLTYEDMEKISFGESVIYVIEYYAPKGLDAEHPLLILMAAIIALSGVVIEKRNKGVEQKEVVF